MKEGYSTQQSGCNLKATLEQSVVIDQFLKKAQEMQPQVAFAHDPISEHSVDIKGQYTIGRQENSRTVFNLPQNPLSIPSYKYQYIKTRVERKRASFEKMRRENPESFTLLKASAKARPSSYIRNRKVVMQHQGQRQRPKSVHQEGPFILGAEIRQREKDGIFSKPGILVVGLDEINKDLEKVVFHVPDALSEDNESPLRVTTNEGIPGRNSVMRRPSALSLISGIQPSPRQQAAPNPSLKELNESTRLPISLEKHQSEKQREI